MAWVGRETNNKSKGLRGEGLHHLAVVVQSQERGVVSTVVWPKRKLYYCTSSADGAVTIAPPPEKTHPALVSRFSL